MRSDPSPSTDPAPHQPSPDQLRWLKSHDGQWSRVEEAFYRALEEQRPRLLEEAAAFGLEEYDLRLPDSPAAEKVAALRRANPDLDLQQLPSDPYPVAVAVLKMLAQ